ncbi:MAG: hypothetical protein WCQ70_03045 [Lentimicrobiaceae bacterium]
MKAIKLFLIGMAMTFAGTLFAQVNISIGIGSPPMWGPVGYSNVQYYYLPDVQAYYDIPSSRFIYYEGGVWVHRTYLPRRYRNYDLYNGYKVVLTDYHGNTPYAYYKTHKVKYAKGYHGEYQKTYGNKPGNGNSKARMSSSGNSYKKSPGQSQKGKMNNSGNNKGNSKGNSKGKSGGQGHGKK